MRHVRTARATRMPSAPAPTEMLRKRLKGAPTAAETRARIVRAPTVPAIRRRVHTARAMRMPSAPARRGQRPKLKRLTLVARTAPAIPMPSAPAERCKTNDGRSAVWQYAAERITESA